MPNEPDFRLKPGIETETLRRLAVIIAQLLLELLMVKPGAILGSRWCFDEAQLLPNECFRPKDVSVTL